MTLSSNAMPKTPRKGIRLLLRVFSLDQIMSAISVRTSFAVMVWISRWYQGGIQYLSSDFAYSRKVALLTSACFR